MASPLPLQICPDPGIPVPEYVPAEIADRLAGKEYSYKLPAVVKQALKTPRKIDAYEHTKKYRVVAEGPHSRRGPWREYYAPHAVKILKVFSQHWVRQVWFCAPEQGGKTSVLLSIIGWVVDILKGDVLFNGPSEKLTKSIFTRKIISMFRASPRLAKLLSTVEKDVGLGGIKTKDGCYVVPSWASSADTMAAFWFLVGLVDECDKGSELTGRETDRVRLILKRLRQSGLLGKLFVSSTPAGLFIYDGIYGNPEKGEPGCAQVWEYRPKCPDCGKYEVWDISRFTDLDTASVKDIKTGSFKVEYVCQCGSVWDNKKREEAIRAGDWICIRGDHLLRPSTVGFHMDCFSCLDIRLEEIALKWLEAETGSIKSKIDWCHGYLCKNYEYEEADHEEDYILRLVDPGQEKGVCPDNPSAVLLIADTQQVGFWFQVFALGWGPDFDVTVIDYGYVKDEAGLVAVQNKTYSSPSGKLYQAESGWIDSGGGLDKDRKKHTRPVQVIDFCKNKRFWVNRHPFWNPLKGWGPRELAWDQSKLDYYPTSVGKKVPIRGGLILTRINAHLGKDELDRRLRIEPGEPGAIRLPVFRDAEGKESDAEARKYAKQLCAWYRKENGIWKAVEGRDDHYGDIFGYCFAIADMIGVKNRKKSVVEPGEEKKQGSSITVLSGGIER